MFLSRPKDDPLDPLHYRLLYREKVLRILEKALKDREGYLEVVDTYLYAGARLEYMLPTKPKAKDILDALGLAEFLELVAC